MKVPESGRDVVGAVSSETRPESVSFVEIVNLDHGRGKKKNKKMGLKVHVG